MNSEGQKRLFSVRSILITIVVGMILIAVPALAGPKQIKNTHTVIVGTELDYPPYSFLDEEGKPSGYNVELSRAIAEVMGLNVEIQIGPWGDIRHGLGTGKIDLISGMYYSKERDKSVDFSPPYTIVHHAIFARRDSPKIKSEADLRGREIIVMRGDIMHDYVLMKGLSKSPVLVDTPAEALQLLASGKYDYALTAKLPGLYWVKKLGLSNIEIVGPLMRPSAYCYAVKDGNTVLLSRFNEGLAIIKETGQVKEIYDKWLGVLEPRGIPKDTILKYGGLSLLALLLILAGSVVWFRTLRSQVAQRTAELEKEIHERKQAENELKEAEERYRALFERSFELVYLCDFEGNFIDANNATLELLGYTNDDIKSLNVTSLLDKDQLSGAFETVEELLKTGSQRELAEYKLSRRNGEYIYIESKGAVIYREGEPYAIQGIARDITDRKLAEEALRESEERYRSLVENQTEFVSRFTPDGTFVFINDVYCHFFEKTKDELIGKKWHPLPVDDDLPLVQEKLQTLSPTNPIVLIENRLLSGKGEIHWIQFVNSGLFDHDGNLLEVQSVGRDITERKQAEEALRVSEEKLARSRKIEAMGLMAGGVAHDLNNILSGIVSYPELLLRNLPEDSPLRKPLKTIQESGMRAADVVEDLMTIARGVASSKETLNLNTLVEEYLKSAEYQKLGSTHSFVNFKTELDPGLLNMSGSPSHIKKILMNLVINASEAIEGSGTVTISTTNQYLDEPMKGYEDIRTGEYVMLTVSDDGTGISPQDLERIFEPFYTKKVMGKSGTGLGLAVVWNTVQDLDGYINVKSSEKGTVFELYFQVTREDVAPEGEEVPLEDYSGHGEKILVVDDEERQREIACGMLAELGYNAESVSSGEEAIEYVKENPVDLILLDMVMPKGINGRKTYEEIIKIRPGQKAIIASGYAKTKEVDKAQALGAGKYIKKPYTLAKVGLAVKEELEKQAVFGLLLNITLTYINLNF